MKLYEQYLKEIQENRDDIIKQATNVGKIASTEYHKQCLKKLGMVKRFSKEGKTLCLYKAFLLSRKKSLSYIKQNVGKCHKYNNPKRCKSDSKKFIIASEKQIDATKRIIAQIEKHGVPNKGPIRY